MEHTIDHLRPATSEYRRMLGQVTDDRLDAPTPCDGWTVRDLINHLVVSNRASAALVRGASSEEAMAIVGGPAPEGDADALRAAHDEQVTDQLAACSEDGAMLLDLTGRRP